MCTAYYSATESFDSSAFESAAFVSATIDSAAFDRVAFNRAAFDSANRSTNRSAFSRSSTQCSATAEQQIAMLLQCTQSACIAQGKNARVSYPLNFTRTVRMEI